MVNLSLDYNELMMFPNLFISSSSFLQKYNPYVFLYLIFSNQCSLFLYAFSTQGTILFNFSVETPNYQNGDFQAF